MIAAAAAAAAAGGGASPRRQASPRQGSGRWGAEAAREWLATAQLVTGGRAGLPDSEPAQGPVARPTQQHFLNDVVLLPRAAAAPVETARR